MYTHTSTSDRNGWISPTVTPRRNRGRFSSTLLERENMRVLKVSPTTSYFNQSICLKYNLDNARFLECSCRQTSCKVEKNLHRYRLVTIHTFSISLLCRCRWLSGCVNTPRLRLESSRSHITYPPNHDNHRSFQETTATVIRKCHPGHLCWNANASTESVTLVNGPTSLGPFLLIATLA